MRSRYKISKDQTDLIEGSLNLLEEHGVLIIDEFLGEDDLKELNEEYHRILNTENEYITPIDYPQGVAKRLDFHKLDNTEFPKTKDVFNQRFMKDLTDRYLGTPNHFNHEIYVAKDEHEAENALNQLHYDKLSTLKFFLYLNDIDRSNGAFEAVPGSHKLAQSIMEFYRKRGKKISTLPNRELPKELDQAVPIEAKAGSLIIFTTDTYHRAGRVEAGKERRIMRAHSRPDPMPKYSPDLLSKQWFNESILNPSRYFYSLSDLFEGKA